MPESEHMPVVRALLSKPPLGPDGKPIEDFNVYVGDFGIGFPGSELRKLHERDEGKYFIEMTKRIEYAHERFITLSGADNERAFRQEFWSKQLYDDLIEKENDYLVLLEPVENTVWTERLSGILGTLATIYRQRGELQACYDLCKPEKGWYDRMLRMYETHVRLRKEQGWGSLLERSQEARCYKDLRYKYHRILLNLSVDLISSNLQHHAGGHTTQANAYHKRNHS